MKKGDPVAGTVRLQLTVGPRLSSRGTLIQTRTVCVYVTIRWLGDTSATTRGGLLFFLPPLLILLVLIHEADVKTAI